MYTSLTLLLHPARQSVMIGVMMSYHNVRDILKGHPQLLEDMRPFCLGIHIARPRVYNRKTVLSLEHIAIHPAQRKGHGYFDLKASVYSLTRCKLWHFHGFPSAFLF
jgi:hypothetical protein